MKAVGRALDETYRQQRPANPQDKTTPKASATTGIQKKSVWRLIVGAIILGAESNSLRNHVMTSHDPAYVITYWALNLLIVAIGVWLVVSYLSKRPRRTLLILSVSWLLFAVGAAYYLQKSKESNKQFATALRQFANDAQNYVEGGSTGKTPSFKSTGDPVNDQILQLLSEFYQSVLPVFADMGKKLGDLETQDDAFKAVVSSKAGLRAKFETEVRKQIESERVIQNTRNDLTRAVNAFLQNVALPNVSRQQRGQIRRGLEDGIKTTFNAQCEMMFTLLEKKEKAKLEAFDFLVAACDYTEFKEGKTGANALLFSTATRQRIDELLKRADSAAEEVNAFQKKQSENTKAKIDQLGR